MEDGDILSRHLDDLVRELDIDLSDKTISQKEYNKRMVIIAYEYSLLGLSDSALLTFINISDEYFKKDGIQELENDKEFHKKCGFLVVIFDYLELVPIEIICNSPPGSA
jgi:hypothetical protein